MATPEQIRAACDTKLNAAWAHVQTRQAAYLTSRGRYFQGVRTHAVTPSDGLETPPSPLGRPSDQSESWLEAGYSLPVTMPMCLEIHTYHGPHGKGYVAVLTVRISGHTWRRVQNVGPETWRTRAWHRA